MDIFIATRIIVKDDPNRQTTSLLFTFKNWKVMSTQISHSSVKNCLERRKDWIWLLVNVVKMMF